MKELHILNNGDSLYDIRTHINENFQTVKDSKNIIYSSNTTNIVADNVQDALDHIGNKINGYAKFTVNDGNYTNNVEDLLTYSANTLSFKVGNAYPNLIATKGDGTTFTRYEIPSQDLSSYTDGNYIVYCNEQQTEILNSVLYEQKTEPVSPNENDIWRNTNTNATYKFEGGSTWTIFDKVPVGTVTKSGNTITNVNTYSYNRTVLATTTQAGILRVATQTDELNYNCNDAAITPENLYRIENFRLADTEYNVNDTVGCPYHHNLQLTCTQAGTTSLESLDTHNISSGDTITDGSVIWTVGSIEIDSSNFVHKTGNETINGTKTFTETIVGNISGNAENDGEGNNIVKTYARKDEIGGGSGVSIGTMFHAMCTNTYIPEGALPLDGTEYSKEQFNDFYDNYLAGQQVVTTLFDSSVEHHTNTPPTPSNKFNIDQLPFHTQSNSGEFSYSIDNKGIVTVETTLDSTATKYDGFVVSFNTQEVYSKIGSANSWEFQFPLTYIYTGPIQVTYSPRDNKFSIMYYILASNAPTSQVLTINKDNLPGIFEKTLYVGKLKFDGNSYKLYYKQIDAESWSLAEERTTTAKLDLVNTDKISYVGDVNNHYCPISYDLTTLQYIVNDITVFQLATRETTLEGSKLLTCSYEDYNSSISTYGQCSKFGVSEPQFVGWITAEASYNIHVNESLTLTDYMEKVPYNGIKISADTYNLPASSSWSITTPKQKLVLTDNVEHNCALFLLKATDNSDLSVNAGYDTEISMYYNTQYHRMTCRIYTGFDTYNETVFGNIVVDTNKYYTYRIEYTGSNYNFYRTEEGSTNEELIGTIEVSDGLYITTKPYLYIDSVGIWDENAYSIQNFETLRFSSSLYGVSPSLEEFKFRVPTIKDGSSVTQAQSDSELGKMYNQSCTTGTDVNCDTVRMRYFVQVADGQINQSQMNWSNWATSLSGKLNADIQSNITEEGKAYIQSLASGSNDMPSNTYVDIDTTGLSSGTIITAPKDGWYWLEITNIKAEGDYWSWLELANLGSTGQTTYDNFTVIDRAYGKDTTSGGICRCLIPCKKVDKIRIRYSNIDKSVCYSKFYYTVSAESQKTSS